MEEMMYSYLLLKALLQVNRGNNQQKSKQLVSSVTQIFINVMFTMSLMKKSRLWSNFTWS